GQRDLDRSYAAAEVAGLDVDVEQLVVRALRLGERRGVSERRGGRQEQCGRGDTQGLHHATLRGWQDAAMGERTAYPHGTFSWVDNATTDQDTAKRFYTALFGWDYDDRPVGD